VEGSFVFVVTPIKKADHSISHNPAARLNSHELIMDH
jgi:hypothetical protein